MNKNKPLTLTELPLNVRASVKKLDDGSRNIISRLSRLGFREGAEVECVGKSPLGGMRAYKIMGAVIALRDEDARCIITSYGSIS